MVRVIGVLLSIAAAGCQSRESCARGGRCGFDGGPDLDAGPVSRDAGFDGGTSISDGASDSMDGSFFVEPPSDLPAASLGTGGVGSFFAESTTPADFGCHGTWVAPMGGADHTFTMEVREFATEDAFDGLCVKVWPTNVVDMGAVCIPGVDPVTGAVGDVAIAAPSGGWFAYRVFAEPAGTPSQSIIDSLHVNAPVPVSDRVRGYVMTEGTRDLLPAVLGRSRAAGTALVVGTVRDCAGEPLYATFIQAYDGNGEPLRGATRTAPAVTYGNGDDFPSADQPWTHVDGSYLALNMPATTRVVFLEVWGIRAGTLQVLGCERAPVLPDSATFVDIGPLRADGPTCPGQR